MRKNGLFPSLLLASVLATGFVVVWGLFGLWAVEVGRYVIGSEEMNESLFIPSDGNVLVQSTSGPGGEVRFRDLDGQACPPPANPVMYNFSSWLLAHLGVPAETPGWEQRVTAYSDGGSPHVYWYFISDARADGSAYFVGYDSRSKACIGYLGRAGFRKEPLPPEEYFPFTGDVKGDRARVLCTQGTPVPGQRPRIDIARKGPAGTVSSRDVYILGRDNKIYHADLHERTVHIALDEPRMRSAMIVPGPVDMVRGTFMYLAARIDDAVLLLDERGGLLRRYQIPESLRERTLNFQETTSGEALLYAKGPSDALVAEVEYRFCWARPGGEDRESSTTLRSPGWLRPYRASGGIVAPAPLVLLGALAVERSPKLMEEGLETSYPVALGRAIGEFAPTLLIAGLLSFGLAVLCYRRQARYGASTREKLVWSLFVLALGLPGWVGYRFGRSWPILEVCSECGLQVPRDRDNCNACEAEYPLPQRKGTEVFA
jgi:hypothetical protein